MAAHRLTYMRPTPRHEQGFRWISTGERQTPRGSSLGTWGLTRLLLLLFVFKVFVFPGPDVTSDVSVIYHGWYEVLRDRHLPAGRRHLAVPARRRPGDPLPRGAALPRPTRGVLRPGVPRRPGGALPPAVRGPAPRPDAARCLGVGGGRTAARPDRVRPVRRDGDRRRGGRAARRRPASAPHGRPGGLRGAAEGLAGAAARGGRTTPGMGLGGRHGGGAGVGCSR